LLSSVWTSSEMNRVALGEAGNLGRVAQPRPLRSEQLAQARFLDREVALCEPAAAVRIGLVADDLEAPGSARQAVHDPEVGKTDEADHWSSTPTCPAASRSTELIQMSVSMFVSGRSQSVLK
jgi:hypothetical protein